MKTEDHSKNRTYLKKLIIFLIAICLSASSIAQVLYENYDNIITIDVPGVDASKLTVTAEGGTLVHKKGAQWIARPTGEEDATGAKKDFIIKVFVDKNAKKELLSTKAYEVKTAYIIDYYDKETHLLPRALFLYYDDVLLKAEGIEKMCFQLNNPNFIEEVAEEMFPVNCNFRFDDSSKGWLGSFIPLYLIITEAWDTSGKKVELPPVILRRK